MEWVILIAIAWFFLARRAKRTAPASSSEPVKILDKFAEAQEGDIFRLDRDDSNVVRFRQTRPGGFTPYCGGLGSGEAVKGTSHRQPAVLAFIYGKNRRLEVEYAPTEEFPEAIAVFGLWDDATGSHREHVGYVEAYIAKEIHEQYVGLPLAAELLTIFLPQGEKQAGIRMFLLRATKPARFLKEPTKRARPKRAEPLPGPAAELERLVGLHAKGEITDEEFTAAKARLLGL